MLGHVARSAASCSARNGLTTRLGLDLIEIDFDLLITFLELRVCCFLAGEQWFRADATLLSLE